MSLKINYNISAMIANNSLKMNDNPIIIKITPIFDFKALSSTKLVKNE